MNADLFNSISLRFNIKRNLLPVFFGRFFPVAILFVISILYSRKLSYDEYGKFQTFWIYSNLLNVIIAFAMPAIILANRVVVFNFFIKSFKNKVILFYFFLYAGIATSFYAIVHNLGDNIKICILVFILFQFITTLVDTFLIKYNQLPLYFVANFIYSILFLCIHLYFYFNQFDLQLLVVCLIMLAALKSLLLFFINKNSLDEYHSCSHKIFFKNWLYLGSSEIVGVIARWLDKMYVVFLISAANFAIFVNGTIEIPLFAVLISAVETFMVTKISQNIGDKKQTVVVFRESFKFLAYISFPVFFMLLIVHEEAFSVIFNNKYNESVPIFLISIFIIPLRINHYGVILQCYNSSNKILLGSIFDIILALLLMSLLYPILGIAGVALSIVISTYFQIFYYIWHSAKLINVRISQLVPFVFLAKLFFILAIIYLCLFFLKLFFSPVQFLILIFLLTTIIITVTLKNYLFSNKNKIYKY